MTQLQPHLAVRNLEVVYSDVILALRGVSLEVPVGGVVALLGANGAGKTTLLRAITGLLPVHRAVITKGSVTLEANEIHRKDAAAIVRLGVAQVMEGRRPFVELSVDDNLRAGAFTCRGHAAEAAARDRVFTMFPRLAERRNQTAGYLSGGEQQMLAIGRALMTAPRLLILDEPSLGLAPRVVQQIREIIIAINAGGTSVLLVEQNAAMALGLASYGYVLENGKVVRDGSSSDLAADADVREFYLGISHTGEHSFRDIRTYRRKKRWSA
ncbi:MAG: ABC transporter ATP-binding protein [Gemmatimonadaceae bacterium]